MDLNKPIIALDYETKEEAQAFLNYFKDESLNVKVGMEMYYSYGAPFVTELIEAGHDIFLDLKLHDIPNTVGRTMKQLAKLGVAMVNVHASGGTDMMRAAREGLNAGTPPGQSSPLLIAVTQLTSASAEIAQTEQQLAITLEESVANYAHLSHKAGLDGVVCSPHEVEMIKANEGPDFLTVTPGIRLENSHIQEDDQTRITTPQKATQLGCDYIVVGRPITQADNPREVYEVILNDWR